MAYPLANAMFQWEEGARELAAIEDPRHRRLADRVVSAVRVEIRRRIGPTFSADELASLYGEGTDWAQQIAIDVAPSAADDAQMLADQSNAVPKAAGRDGAARFSLLNEPEPIAAADADLDGKVTLAEWMARTDRRFAKLDWQKTGKLTMDSLLHLQPKDQKEERRKGGGGEPPK